MRERRLAMRDNNRYQTIHYGNITNVTNVTRVTNVTNVTSMHANGCGRPFQKQHKPQRHEQRGKRPERMPAMLRLGLSGGMLDQDEVVRMDDRQIVDGLCDAWSYAGRQMSQSVKGCGKSIRNVGSAACDVVSSLFSVVEAILR